MKTPREILLRRHQSANARLDQLRTEVLSTTLSHPIRALRRDGRENKPLAVRGLLVVWRELIWPCRRVWAGMAALWLVMWGINRGLSDTPKAAQSAHTASAPALLLFEALEEQRRLLAELIPPVSSQPTEPPRHNPKPRSDRHSEMLMM